MLSRSNMAKNTKCCVLGCYNNSALAETDNTSYFRLPKDKRRAKLWLQAIRRQPAKRLLVCEHHFESQCIIQGTTRKRLVAGAVPTRDLPDSTVVEAKSRGRSLVTHRATQVPDEEKSPTTDQPLGGIVVKKEVEELPTIDLPLLDIFVKEETVVGQERTAEEESQMTDQPLVDNIYEEETVVGQKRSADEPNNSALLDCPIKREKPDDEAQTDPDVKAELDMLIKLSNAYLSPELAKFVSVQVSLKHEIKNIGNGKSRNEELLFFALKLYNAFPQTYKLMHGSLGLPSTSEMNQQLRPWEEDERWVRVLRARFDGATAEQRECVVCMARVPLRPGLRYDAARDRLLGLHETGGEQLLRVGRTGVLVVARGVHARWRQPLACGLLANQSSVPARHMWLYRVISSASDAGLNIRALITDFDDNFFTLYKPVSPERPYFIVNEKQVYCFYDCTQLMVKFRDCLMQYNMNFGGLTASWEHLEELYDWNRVRAYKLAADLTAHHVRPPKTGSARRRAALAVEALSPRVAAALAAAVDLRVLDDSAHGTVQLITVISKLYETLHSKVAVHFKSGVQFLNETLGHLEKLFLLNRHTGVPERDPGLVGALRGATRALLALHQRLQLAGAAALHTRAFNNDPLHDFFDRLRTLNDGRYPTGPQLLGAFRKSFAFHIMKSFKPTSVGEGLGEFLQAAAEVRRVKRAPSTPAEAECAVSREALDRLARTSLSLPTRSDVERELLKCCLQERPCCAAARLWASRDGLPDKFSLFLEVLEKRFRAALRLNRLADKALLALLLRGAADDHLDAPCACFPTLYLKTLFMRYRIRALVRYNNLRWVQNDTTDFALNHFTRWYPRSMYEPREKNTEACPKFNSLLV